MFMNAAAPGQAAVYDSTDCRLPEAVPDTQHGPGVTAPRPSFCHRRRKRLFELDVNLHLVIRLPLRLIAALPIFLAREAK
jgi:hypothetical protein